MEETLKDHLKPKKEYVIYVRPSKEQWIAAQKVLPSDAAQEAKDSMNRFSLFAIIRRLRMTCFHPKFASKVTDDTVREFLTKYKGEQHADLWDDFDSSLEEEETEMEPQVRDRSAEILRESPMFRICLDILSHKVGMGSKFWVFSQFRKPLGLLEHLLHHAKLGFYRIDGEVEQRDRSKFVKDFNKPQSQKKIMLITTS